MDMNKNEKALHGIIRDALGQAKKDGWGKNGEMYHGVISDESGNVLEQCTIRTDEKGGFEYQFLKIQDWSGPLTFTLRNETGRNKIALPVKFEAKEEAPKTQAVGR